MGTVRDTSRPLPKGKPADVTAAGQKSNVRNVGRRWLRRFCLMASAVTTMGAIGIDPRTLPAQRDQRSTRHLSLFIDHARIEVIEQDQGYPLTRTSSLRARQNHIRDCEGGHSYTPAPGASDFLLRGHHF